MGVIPAFFERAEEDLKTFESICSQSTSLTDYSFAERVEKNVVIYEGNRIRSSLKEQSHEFTLRSEINRCLSSGPGVLVIKNAYPNLEIIDAVTDLFKEIIKQENEAGLTGGDHFGANERIWNSLQKVCVRDPALFIEYYGDAILAFMSRAWLGPYYQITAQVNNVKPGSASQSPHRDYHLGFQAEDVVAQFPAQAQMMSQYLTLQGAIAHTDMPLLSGPTMLLPFSQQFPAGYMRYRDPEFVSSFKANNVQLPLEKGDAIYFSPALFHGAGANESASDRLANLVQISSAFGRPMEMINRDLMIDAVYPVLVDQREHLDHRKTTDVIASIADGYSFPTNLDTDPPIGGNAPVTTQQFVYTAVQENWTLEELRRKLDLYDKRRRA